MHTSISEFRNSKYKNKYNKLQSQIFSKYVFSNIDRMRYYLFLKPVSAVHNLDRLANGDIKETELLIIYSFDGRPICLNN